MPNLPNLSGSNIQDTYQRVLHTDGSLIYNGTGSVISNMPTTASFAITASHALEAVVEITKEVSSSYAETASMASDSFNVQGDITASGNISSSKIITTEVDSRGANSLTLGDVDGYAAGSRFLINQTNKTITAASADLIVGQHGLSQNLNVIGEITASGAISASGTIFSNILNSVSDTQVGGDLIFTQNGASQQHLRFSQNNDQIYWDGSDIIISIDDTDIFNFKNSGLSISGNLTATGDTTLGNAITDEHTIQGTITASGDISSSGTIKSDRFQYGDNSTYIDFNEAGENTIRFAPNGTKAIDISSALIHINPLNTPGMDFRVDGASDNLIIADAELEKVAIGTATGPQNAKLHVEGNLNVTAPITASSNISSSGTVIVKTLSIPAGNALLGSGSLTLGSPSTNVTLHSTGNITASGDISASGIIYADQYAVDGYLALDSNSTTGRVFPGQISTAIEIGRTGGTNKNISLFGPVTASGVISASGNLIGDDLQLGGEVGLLSSTDLLTIGNTLGGELNTVYFKTAGVGIGTQNPQSLLSVAGTFNANGDITGSGGMKLTGTLDIGAGISSSGQTANYLKERRFDSTVPVNNGTNMFYDGDTIRHGTGPSGDDANIVAGKVYYLSTSDQWEEADSGASATSTGLLGLAVRDEMNIFLIRGFMANASFGAGAAAGIGGPIYLGSNAAITGTAPTSGYVRVIGYKINVSDRRIYFNPDNTWVELT